MIIYIILKERNDGIRDYETRRDNKIAIDEVVGRLIYAAEESINRQESI